MPDQWKQGVGGLVRRYRQRRNVGISRDSVFPWTNDQLADGVRKGIDDIDDMREFEDFPSASGSLFDIDSDGGLAGERDAPIDLHALRADDELLDALGSGDGASSFGRPAYRQSESDLESLLRAWRAEAEADPIPQMYDTEAAVAVIQGAAQERRKPRRWLVPVASAAAVLVIAFTSLGVAARDAQPGDPLWGLTQVLYADHAKSVQAAVTVRTELSHASVALQEGHFTEARTALSLAQASLPSVDSSDGKADLQARGQQLAAALNATSVSPPSVTVSTGVPSTVPPASTTTQPTTTTTTAPSSPSSTTPTTTTTTAPSSPSSPPTDTDSAAGPGTVSTSSQTDSHQSAQSPSPNSSGTG